jgi:U3 small nucleolar RNA-associated protein 18
MSETITQQPPQTQQQQKKKRKPRKRESKQKHNWRKATERLSKAPIRRTNLSEEALEEREVALTDILFGGSTFAQQAKEQSIADSARVAIKKKRSRDEIKDEDSDDIEEDEEIQQLKDEDLFMVDNQKEQKYDDMMKDIEQQQKQLIKKRKLEDDKEKTQKKVLIPLQPVWQDNYSDDIFIQVDTANDDDEELDLKELRNTSEANKNIIQSYLSKKDYKKDEELPDDTALLSGVTYEDQMRNIYTRLHKTPTWAQLPTEKVTVEKTDEQLVVEERFKTSDRISKAELGGISTDRVFDSSRQVSKGKIDFALCGNANDQEKPHDLISSVFHPHTNLLATLSTDKIIRVFQIGGKKNSLVDRIVAKPMETQKKKNKPKFVLAAADVSGMAFTADGTELIITMNHQRTFYVADMVTGAVKLHASLNHRAKKIRGGISSALLPIIRASLDNEIIAIAAANNSVELLSRQTKFSIGQLTMSETIRDMVFTKDSETLFVTTKSGKVYLWNVKQQRVKHIFFDEGSIDTTCISIAEFPGRSRLATGSSFGVVNLYDVDAVLSSERPKPLKAFMSLTTSVTKVQFNADGRLLAISSKEKAGSLRLIHVESMSVYADFPLAGKYVDASTELYTATDFDFSSASQYLVLATGKNARLYEFPFYASTKSNK